MKSMKKSVALLCLFVLAACAQPTAEEPQAQDFRTGTEGVYMEFVPNLPPPRVFDNDPLSVLLQVENRGASDVGGGNDRIFLSGFDNTIITGIPTSGEAIPYLEGRGPFVPRGGVDAVSFTGQIRSLAGQRVDKYQPTILATACYQYETVASTQVCIDPDPFAPTRTQKVCTPSTVSTGSQGAPIAVTSVELDAAPGKTRFRVNIQNVGRGDVFRTRAMNSCNPYSKGLGFADVDFLDVVDVTVSDTSIRRSCRPLDETGQVRLTDGRATLFCEFDIPRQQNAYLTPLNVILRYGYRQTIAKQVEIRPVS